MTQIFFQNNKIITLCMCVFLNKQKLLALSLTLLVGSQAHSSLLCMLLVVILMRTTREKVQLF